MLSFRKITQYLPKQQESKTFDEALYYVSLCVKLIPQDD